MSAAAHRRASPAPPRGSRPPRSATPSSDVEATVAERQRLRDALVRCRLDSPDGHGNFVCGSARTSPGRASSRRPGLVVRIFPRGNPISPAPARRRTTSCSRALGAVGRAGAGRVSARLAHQHGDGAADRARPRRLRPLARRHRHRLPRPPPDALGLPRPASISSCSQAGDLDVDEHHTVEDVLAALGDALAEALGDTRRASPGTGSASVPMDESLATAADRPRDAGRTRRSSSPSRATGSAGWRRRSSPTRSSGSRCRAGSRLHLAVLGRGRPPRRRGRVQGSRPGRCSQALRAGQPARGVSARRRELA